METTQRADSCTSCHPPEEFVRCSVGLLTIPVELRLQIYDYILADRPKRVAMPIAYSKARHLKHARSRLKRLSKEAVKGAAIFRTSKGIHLEANSTLYSSNVFHASEAAYMLLFAEQIGLTLVHIKSISLFVPCRTKVELWLQLFQKARHRSDGATERDNQMGRERG